MLENLEDFISLCEKVFKSTKPVVDKGEARAGVLGFHPYALLVIAIDHINRQEIQLEQYEKEDTELIEAHGLDPSDKIDREVLKRRLNSLIGKNRKLQAEIEELKK